MFNVLNSHGYCKYSRGYKLPVSIIKYKCVCVYMYVNMYVCMHVCLCMYNMKCNIEFVICVNCMYNFKEQMVDGYLTYSKYITTMNINPIFSSSNVLYIELVRQYHILCKIYLLFDECFLHYILFCYSIC